MQSTIQVTKELASTSLKQSPTPLTSSLVNFGAFLFLLLPSPLSFTISTLISIFPSIYAPPPTTSPFTSSSPPPHATSPSPPSTSNHSSSTRSPPTYDATPPQINPFKL